MQQHYPYKILQNPIVKGKIVGTAVFDLSGRKVNNPTKGIYVKDGKKFIVK